MIPGSTNPLLLQSAVAAGGYQISRSLRFNSPDSAYLSRTPASAGNRKTWTWAGWVKRSNLTDYNYVFGVGTTNANDLQLTFQDTGELTFFSRTTSTTLESQLVTTAKFRDASAWMHIVLSYDSTQATNTNRIKIYINGTQISSTEYSTATWPALNQDTSVNNTLVHYIGSARLLGYCSAMLADIHLIDGQALDPTSFGEFDATTGVWVPIEYTGTYGTNGFHLDFADNASTTTIGYDAAGSNDWTANNLSVTAGAGNDSLVDSPTNYGTDTGVGGEVRGNCATFNSLVTSSTFANGNLDVTGTGANKSTIGMSSGKYYCEYTINSASVSFGPNWGIANGDNSVIGALRAASGRSTATNCTVTLSGHSSNITSGTIGVALDMDALECKIYHNNTLKATVTAFPAAVYFFYFGGDSGSDSISANFGQRAFAYTAPSGFKALCTANLPTPSVTKPSTAFDVKLYTGNGSTQTISGLAFSPDLVWIKGRSGATDHALYDTVRGVQRQLESNTTTDETTESTGLTAFNSDGFALGALAQANTSSATYAAWCWDESVSAGFDIVTYTGNGSARTIAHSLGVAPSMIIVKARTTASTDQGWPVYHSANTAAPATDYLLLNSTAATADLDTVWNDTAPTSSVFSVGTNALVNANNDTYVAYCFAPVSGYSSFGSYTGNGSADGPFIYTGFRPRWILIKDTGGAINWRLLDTARNPSNLSQNGLFPNTSGAESTTNMEMDILSNGFKVRATGDINASGNAHVYAAFAESPFNFSRAR